MRGAADVAGFAVAAAVFGALAGTNRTGQPGAVWGDPDFAVLLLTAFARVCN